MKKCERHAQQKPAYETPKVSKLDEMESYLGSIQASCLDGSGDSEGCNSGNAAAGSGCAGDGNSAIGTTQIGDQTGCAQEGNSPSAPPD